MTGCYNPQLKPQWQSSMSLTVLICRCWWSRWSCMLSHIWTSKQAPSIQNSSCLPPSTDKVIQYFPTILGRSQLTSAGFIRPIAVW